MTTYDANEMSIITYYSLKTNQIKRAKTLQASNQTFLIEKLLNVNTFLGSNNVFNIISFDTSTFYSLKIHAIIKWEVYILTNFKLTE